MAAWPLFLIEVWEIGDSWKDTHVGPVLPEQRRGWSLMIFCARATRGLRRPSPGLMARLGVPVGGRVRKLRAVEDQSAPIPEERTSKLRGIICNVVRVPHVDQHGCLSKKGKASELGWNLRIPTGDPNQPSQDETILCLKEKGIERGE
jgi:hypothetical protein